MTSHTFSFLYAFNTLFSRNHSTVIYLPLSAVRLSETSLSKHIAVLRFALDFTERDYT